MCFLFLCIKNMEKKMITYFPRCYWPGMNFSKSWKVVGIESGSGKWCQVVLEYHIERFYVDIIIKFDTREVYYNRGYDLKLNNNHDI